MSLDASEALNFSKILSQLDSEQIWEYERGPRNANPNARETAFQALQRPADFPAIEAAIVSGDHVALAVDPYTPQLMDVLAGVLDAVKQTEASEIDVVLGDEASDETLTQIQDAVGDVVRVVRHEPSNRESLRYLGADAAADPIYLNRRLVDADFVLPIVATRPRDSSGMIDLTGVFPFFADAAARGRYFQPAEPMDGPETDPSEPAWLLGVQIMLCVSANNEGQAGDIVAGTPDAIRKQLKSSRRAPDEFPPPAQLVIASMDGGAQQQTWQNAARAVSAAVGYCEPSGTIVLWSQIGEEPNRSLAQLSDPQRKSTHQIEPPAEGEFPPWDPTINPATTLAEIGKEHRLLLHGDVSGASIEAMGLGLVEDVEQLSNLIGEFESCGVLRAAQFAGDAIDASVQTP
ncbi:MAG: lactate racemase domain-containing protein [Rubripirellula sp.]